MNYMNTSFCFIDPKYTKNDLQIKVVKGFHGLHHYAHEFWFQHLLQYAKSGVIVEDEDLEDPIEEIREFWKDDPGKGAKALKLDDTTSAETIRSQLEVMQPMEQAQKMGIDILTFRKFLSQENNSHQDPESELETSKRGRL